MKISARTIGAGAPVYVIAELGVNHDGSVDRALELVEQAAGAGADAVKLQLFRADMLMGRAARLAAYQKIAGETDPVTMLRRLELSAAEMRPIVERAHALGMHAIVTVFSVELVDEAERLEFDAYKTASPDIVHTPLLERLMATGKALIVSTGASTMEEVKRAVQTLSPARERLALLQCVSSYPTAREHAELGGIVALREAFGHLPIGYSDHTSEEKTGAEAVELGACVLEKHFTYSRGAPGPDHAASLEREGMRAYGLHARGARATGAVPSGVRVVKRVLEIEEDVRRVSRQSITAVRALATGQVLRRADVTFKRPGTGILACRLEEVLGAAGAGY